MGKPRFAAVRNLFAGTSLSTPPETDEDLGEEQDGKEATSGKAPVVAKGPSQAQIEAAVADDIAKAVKAESDRWNGVMSSEAGAANPKAAAKLLTMAGGASSAEEVIAALDDLGAPSANTPKKEVSAEEKKRLASDEETDPNTGGAGGGTERKGEGREATSDLSERRAQRAERRNKQALAHGGKQVQNGRD